MIARFIGFLFLSSALAHAGNGWSDVAYPLPGPPRVIGSYAAGCIGVAVKAHAMAVDYVPQRETFGAPLSSRQAVTQQVAEHYSKLQAARLVGYQTLMLADMGRPHTSEAAMAKWMAPAWSVEAIHACLRLHGWAGYGNDMSFGQRMRDVIGLEMGDGTPEIMKAIVARGLYGTATHR